MNEFATVELSFQSKFPIIYALNCLIFQQLLDVQFTLSDPSCIDEQDGIGRTALFYAVHFHQNEMLNYLLENEADVNISSHGNHNSKINKIQKNMLRGNLV